jgi:hypothetical protein
VNRFDQSFLIMVSTLWHYWPVTVIVAVTMILGCVQPELRQNDSLCLSVASGLVVHLSGPILMALCGLDFSTSQSTP